MKEVIENYQTTKKALLDARTKKDSTAERAAAKDFAKAEKDLYSFDVENAKE